MAVRVCCLCALVIVWLAYVHVVLFVVCVIILNIPKHGMYLLLLSVIVVLICVCVCLLFIICHVRLHLSGVFDLNIVAR
jgi:hypothetical protein